MTIQKQTLTALLTALSLLGAAANRAHAAPAAGAPIWVSGTPVLTAPYQGIVPGYNGGNLLVNLPKINYDRALLKQQASLFDPSDTARSTYYLGHPLVVLSGSLEGQLSYQDHAGDFNGKNATRLNLSAAELDAAIFANYWTTGHLALAYDSAQGTHSSIGASKVFLDRASVTFGNLNASPFYGSFGQFYVPFGEYGSDLISAPATKSLGRTKARALSLGLSQTFNANQVNLGAFAFAGRTKPNQDASDAIRGYGANAEYRLNQPAWNLEVGASYLANLADADGIGGADRLNTHTLKAIPGVDVRGSVSTEVGAGQTVSLKTEYLTATKSFEERAFKGNDAGLKPSAWHTEAAYHFSLDNKPSKLAIGYDCSKDAQPLELPKSSILAAVQTTVSRNTVAGLEFRHDKDYKVSQQGTGKTNNTVTLQIGLHF